MFRTHRSIRVALVWVAVAVATDFAAEPGTFPQTKVHYAGTQTIRLGEMTLTSRVRAQPGKMRSEIRMGSSSLTAILREDLGVGWNLLPGGNSYMEFSLGQATAGGSLPFGAELVLFEKQGSEPIDGRTADRYRFESRLGEISTSGELWLTPENIPLRLRATSAGGPIEMTLSDLVLEHQPDAWFEIPDGAEKLVAPGAGE